MYYQVPPPPVFRTPVTTAPQLDIKYSSYPVYATAPSKHNVHSRSRSTSHSPAAAARYTYSTPPQLPGYFTAPAYTYQTPVPYTTKQAAPKQRADFATTTERLRSKANRHAGGQTSKGQGRSASKKQATSGSQRVYKVTINDDGYEYDYQLHGSPPPPYDEDTCHHQYPTAQAHGETYKQVDPPIYRMRTRSSSHPQSPPRRQSRAAKPYITDVPQKATAHDAARAGIPAGYSYKNWDPTEEPIFLLGSVFDANSLGKWIYDWTVYHHGASTPMADLSGDLWLGLIELASKIKRAEECLPRIRNFEDRDLVDDFLESGERLWNRLGKILKACEDHMWRAAKAENGGKKTVPSMGAKSGCEFVDSIFGRDRKLEDTEKLMTGIRFWTMRFEANCEDIMRNPRG